MKRKCEGGSRSANKRIWMCEVEIRRVSSGIMYVGICIKSGVWSVIRVYAPGIWRSEEERDSLLDELKGCIEAYEDKGRSIGNWRYER